MTYYQRIKDGSEIAGRWVKLVYSMIVKGLETRAFFYDAKKAHRAIAFIENFCRHHEGTLAPQLIKLELWQQALTAVIFGVVDDTGARQFREVCLVIARKNGKTLFAAAIIAYCVFCDGEYGAKCYCLAPKLDQADIVFEEIKKFINSDGDLQECFNIVI